MYCFLFVFINVEENCHEMVEKYVRTFSLVKGGFKEIESAYLVPSFNSKGKVLLSIQYS